MASRDSFCHICRRLDHPEDQNCLFLYSGILAYAWHWRLVKTKKYVHSLNIEF